jgi:hypothetical protein
VREVSGSRTDQDIFPAGAAFLSLIFNLGAHFTNGTALTPGSIHNVSALSGLARTEGRGGSPFSGGYEETLVTGN